MHNSITEKRGVGGKMENQEKEITIIGAREPVHTFINENIEPEPVPDNAFEEPEEEASEEGIVDSQDDFLLSQIDEFRIKAKQLQELLRLKEDKAKELQQIVNERTDKAEELQQIVNERQVKADGITAEVAKQINGMADKVDARLENVDAHLETLDRKLADQVDTKLESLNLQMTTRLDSIQQYIGKLESVDESLEKMQQENASADRRAQETSKAVYEMTEQLQEVKQTSEKLDNVKADLADKIHTESVQSYRNTQELIREVDEKLNKIDIVEKGVHSVKQMTTAIVVLTVIDLLGVAAAVILSFGLF
jgi:chromosome segregation ATPase